MKNKKGLMVLGIILLFVSACFSSFCIFPQILGEHYQLFRILDDLVFLMGLLTYCFVFDLNPDDTISLSLGKIFFAAIVAYPINFAFMTVLILLGSFWFN